MPIVLTFQKLDYVDYSDGRLLTENLPLEWKIYDKSLPS
jgi:hypothetical protein